MKTRYFILVIISCAFILAGCSNAEDDADAAAEQEVEEEEATESEESEELEETEEGADYRSDIGNLEIWIGGEVSVEEDKVIVEGESNLLPGSYISSTGVSGGWAVIDYQSSTEVEEDGTFYFEFPGRESNIVVNLRLSTGNDHVKEHYGENLEKAIGNQVYKTDTKGEYEAKYTFEIDTKQELPHTIDLETPDWTNVPSDYGDPDVWIEVEYTTKHNLFYFEGKTNLEEGSWINGNITDPKDLLSSAWSFENTQVNPDGSFELRIPYWDIRSGMEMHFTFQPADSSWDNIIGAYGEEGEKLSGDLVKTEEDGIKYAQLSIDLAAPDMNPPEEVDLTMEEEEIKMQVPDDLLFDFDKSKLKSEAKETLDGIITELKELPDGTEIQFNGHTDNVGEADYNINLSEERAHAVADYINKNSDLDTFSIEIQGFGDTKPIASNEEEEYREKNRRVEIVINPQ